MKSTKIRTPQNEYWYSIWEALQTVLKHQLGWQLDSQKNPSGVRLAHKFIPEHPHIYCTIYVAIIEWKSFKKIGRQRF